MSRVAACGGDVARPALRVGDMLTKACFGSAEERKRSATSMAQRLRPDLLSQCLQNAIRLPAAQRDREGLARFPALDGITVQRACGFTRCTEKEPA